METKANLNLDINELIKLWHYIASNDGKITQSELISVSYQIADEFHLDLDKQLDLINLADINEDLNALLLAINKKYAVEEKLDLLISIYLFSLYDEYVVGMTTRLKHLFEAFDMPEYYELIKKVVANANEFSIDDFNVKDEVKVYLCDSIHKRDLFKNIDYALLELNGRHWLIWKKGKNFFIDEQNIMGANRLIRLNENQEFSFENLQVATDKIHLGEFLKFLKRCDEDVFDIDAKKDAIASNDKINKIAFLGLSCGFSKNKAQTKNINLQVEDGDFVAIIGPSGSGKSTLFKTLMGENHIVDGQIHIANGIQTSEFDSKNYNQLFQYSAQFGYVSQQEVFVKELSVLENIYYYYSLYSKANNAPTIDFAKKVDSLLLQLGLKEQKNQQVYHNGKYALSGGQRKKLNIAMELIKSPNVLLIDEPTSGLSSQESVELIEFLKTLSQDKIVFTIIHQPSFEIFIKYNKVIVLNKEGYNIFSGDAKEALEVFHIVSDKQSCCDLSSYSHVDPSVLLEANREKTSFWKTLGRVKSKLKDQI